MHNSDSDPPNGEIEQTTARLEKDIEKVVQIEEVTVRVEKQIEQAAIRVEKQIAKLEEVARKVDRLSDRALLISYISLGVSIIAIITAVLSLIPH